MRPAPTGSGGGGPRRVEAEDALTAVLRRQRDRDLLGPDPIPTLVAHSRGFAALVDGRPELVVDLGSGGGIPGLVLATLDWPEARFTLVDASQRRGTYLELAVAELGLGDRVEIVVGRGEEVGRSPTHRAQGDVVVARSFGPPAVLAECAAPLLRVGGVLVVSEPPRAHGERWPLGPLAELGLAVETTTQVDGATYTRLRQVTPCPDRFPRRPGVPEKRPLFREPSGPA